jgi:hypothetical protein
MPDAPPPELLPSLGRLVRGLSALFWGLPLALLICFQTARTDWLHSFGVVPPLATTGVLWFGLWQMRSFQPQERSWLGALDRALFVGAVNFALAPFLYWWSRMPQQPLFGAGVALLAFTSIIYLSHLNLVLSRLGAMLPDETLHQETRQFTAFNRLVLSLTFALAVAYLALLQYPGPVPGALVWLFNFSLKFQMLVIITLVLVPLAMTMALLWKAKEVILESVFRRRA